MSKTQKFKKIAPILLIVAILISIIGGGTLAYITREARAENTITAGDIKVKLYNMRDDDTTMPKDGIHSVLANITYPNVVYAKNECDYPEYIRMRVSKQVTDKDGTKLDSSKMHPIRKKTATTTIIRCLLRIQIPHRFMTAFILIKQLITHTKRPRCT